jgi:putative transcriptional regulator
MEAESLGGRLLVATPLLGDPNFRRTVILIVEDEPGEGTLGVVLNRPTEVQVEQVLQAWTDLVTGPSVVFKGGPVSPNSALALALARGEDEPDEGTLGVVLNRPTEVQVEQVLQPWTDLVTGPSVVFKGGPVSPNSALALALARGEDEPLGWRSLDGSSVTSRIGLVDLEAPPELLAGGITSLRVFAGYAGWGPGQLQAEIEEGAWYVLPGEPTDAFLAEPERLWPEVLRRQGGEFAIVATYPDDPLLN